GLLVTALVCAAAARRHDETRRTSFRWATALAACVLLIGAADFVFVYRPLAAMISQEALPPEFAVYHHASRWINSAALAISAAAAGLAVWPEQDRRNEGCRHTG